MASPPEVPRRPHHPGQTQHGNGRCHDKGFAKSGKRPRTTRPKHGLAAAFARRQSLRATLRNDPRCLRVKPDMGDIAERVGLRNQNRFRKRLGHSHTLHTPGSPWRESANHRRTTTGRHKEFTCNEPGRDLSCAPSCSLLRWNDLVGCRSVGTSSSTARARRS